MSESASQTSETSRRTFIKGVTAAGSAAAIGLRAPAVLAKSTKPLRIGVLNTFTGTNANPTKSNMDGISLYLDQIGSKIAGRKVELVTADDQFNPQIGLQKVRALVENDHVDLLFGPQASNVAVAVLNYCTQTKTIMLAWAGGDSLTWGRIPSVFRPSLTSWQLATPMGGWVYQNVAKEVVLVASDFVAGHDVMREFKKAFTPKGGKVLKEIYPPVATGDYSAYLTDILSINPPALYVFLTGTDAVRFARQFKEFGLQGKVKLTGFAPLTDGSTIPAQG
ncbi:MAG TPA: ABC transporter substrate-binding protein, partial [Beijerinckiaceae bacterium]|nr:ABC transporter substrate-binding protein [Beijerinckiaceae bacterium]